MPKRPKLVSDGSKKSIAAIAEAYFEKGYESAKQAFDSIAPQYAPLPYSIIKAHQRSSVIRTDVDSRDNISYFYSGPPAQWEPPYSVLYVKFDPLLKKDYMAHSGEEILLPVKGNIQYGFFWSPGGKHSEREPPRRVLSPILKSPSIIRINPSIPHHTWATGKVEAEAWMIMRHMMDAASAITLDPWSNSRRSHSASRRATEEHLRNPSNYALYGWGIAEKIRLYRQRAALTLDQLAASADITPSFLSKIEASDCNVSIDVLIRIARALRMNLGDILPPKPWKNPYEITDLSNNPLFHHCEDLHHYVHIISWLLRNDPVAESDLKSPRGGMSSWIMHSGAAVFEIKYNGYNTRELLEEGSVLHLRNDSKISKITPLLDGYALEIIYSTDPK